MRRSLAVIAAALSIGLGCSASDCWDCNDSAPSILVAKSPPTLTEASGGHYAIDFGTVAVGMKLTGSLIFSNAGTTPLTIRTAAASTDAQFALSLTSGASVPPGNPINVPVAFKPLTVGDKSATITLQTDSPNTPTVMLTFTGTGVN